MQPASRTPEGEPNRCSICGVEIVISPSRPPGDAPCPQCGTLLWFDRRTRSLGHILTVGQAAKICRVSLQTIIRCMDKGELDGFRAPGTGARRIASGSLRAFMTRYEIPTTALDESP